MWSMIVSILIWGGGNTMKSKVTMILCVLAVGIGLWLGIDSQSKEKDQKVSKTLDRKADVIEKTINHMTLEEKVGQMFIVRLPEKDALTAIDQYHLGGYILYARDFRNHTKESATSMIKSYQDNSKIPMLIGVDEEGGTVNRVSLYPAFRNSPFRSPQEVYKSGGWEMITSDAIEKSKLLRSLGINVNFAPVVDVSENPNDYIYNRSFGSDADMTAQYAKKVVKAMHKEHIEPVLKHFPGYGNNVNTHTGIAHDTRSYEQFETSDFIPFQEGVKAGANIILVSHNIVHSMDDKYPASLSPKVHKILRETLSFDGVVVTDDLYMEGITQYVKKEEAAILAVQAGNDLICCTDFQTQIPAVVSAVKDGRISEERINSSVRRILKLKKEMGIL